MFFRDIEFGNVFNAPGSRGFFDEKYLHHFALAMLGHDWSGSTFVAKTTTYYPKEDNLPMKKDGITPKEIIPRCIYVNPQMFWNGHVLNAVGLSGPGAVELFIHPSAKFWYEYTQPFILSFMSISKNLAGRLEELSLYIKLVNKILYLKGSPKIKNPIALHLNFACPNVGLSRREELVKEVWQSLDIASTLNIPLIPNFNALVPPETIADIANHTACDGFWLSNTIPWGTPEIDWEGITGHKTSPLIDRGFTSGGLSGPACLPFVIKQITAARKLGVTKPIIAGNGVQNTISAQKLLDANVDGIALGVINLLRPFMMQEVICYINSHFKDRELGRKFNV